MAQGDLPVRIVKMPARTMTLSLQTLVTRKRIASSTPHKYWRVASAARANGFFQKRD